MNAATFMAARALGESFPSVGACCSDCFPGEVGALIVTSADIATFDASVQQLNTDFTEQASKTPLVLANDWITFTAEWAGWRERNSEGTLGIPLIIQRDLLPEFETFVSRFNELRRRFLVAGVITVVPASGPTGNPQTFLDRLEGTLGLTGVSPALLGFGVAGLAVVGFSAYQLAKGR